MLDRGRPAGRRAQPGPGRPRNWRGPGCQPGHRRFVLHRLQPHRQPAAPAVRRPSGEDPGPGDGRQQPAGGRRGQGPGRRGVHHHSVGVHFRRPALHLCPSLAGAARCLGRLVAGAPGGGQLDPLSRSLRSATGAVHGLGGFPWRCESVDGCARASAGQWRRGAAGNDSASGSIGLADPGHPGRERRCRSS
ncbi:hypothetical protein D3C85_1324380 [compost metagenome]